MAFTVPIDSAVTGEIAPASLWNTFVRDNLMATMHLIARKSANQTSTSTTLANDNHLAVPLLANEVWFTQTILLVDSPAAADFKVGWVNYPAGATAFWGVAQYDSANGVAWIAQPGLGATGNLVKTQTTPSQDIATNGGTTQGFIMNALFIASSTPGTVNLQWAQVTASGTTTVFTNSFTMGMRLSP
jgi:hypothetical protein